MKDRMLGGAVVVAIASTVALAACKKAPEWLVNKGAAAVASAHANGASTAGNGPGGAASSADVHDGGDSDLAPTKALGRTGRDADVDRKEAASRFSTMVEAAKAAEPDCQTLVDTLEQTLPLAGTADGSLPTPDSKAGFVAMARCARRRQRWTILADLSQRLVALEASAANTALLSRAQIGFGKYDVAAEPLLAFLKGWPYDPDAYLTAGLASCRVEDDDTTLKRVDAGLAAEKGKSGSAADDLAHEGHLTKVEALFRKGKLDDAARELDAAVAGGDESGTARLRDALAVAKTSKLGVLIDSDALLPTAMYSQFGKAGAPFGPLATVRLFNFAGRQMAVRIEVTIPGVTQSAVKEFTFTAKKEVFKATPAFTPLFDPGHPPASANSATPPKLIVRIFEGAEKKVIYEHEEPITLLPQGNIPLFVHPRSDEVRRTRELLATAYAPTAPAVATVAQSLKGAGAKGESNALVKALWEELSTRGFSFERGILPTEDKPLAFVRGMDTVIDAKGGTSHEGALLMASILGAMGLEPLLVDAPAGAFVGWLATKADHASEEAIRGAVNTPLGDAYFIEVTAVGKRPYVTAALRGNAEYAELGATLAFADERAGLLQVSKGLLVKAKP